MVQPPATATRFPAPEGVDRLEPSPQRFPALLLLAQRFVYRQLMYGVVIRSLVAALRGRMVGWGKLERSGSVIGAGKELLSPSPLGKDWDVGSARARPTTSKAGQW